MIQIDFGIRLPYHWGGDREVCDLFCRSGSLWGTKHWEFEITFISPTVLLEFDLDLYWSGRDHAGPRVAATLLGLHIDAHVYDERHWNYSEDRWERPGDDL